MARHGYFVVQARAETVGAALQLSGVVENLATGDKRSFHDVGELSGLLTQWGQQAAPGPAPTARFIEENQIGPN